MPYYVLDISNKLESTGFDSEADARAYCRKWPSTNYVIFESPSDTPVAVYVKGQGYNCAPVEQDVPYSVYKLNPDRLPKAEGFVWFEDKHFADTVDMIEAAFRNSARTVWVIATDPNWVFIYHEPRRAKHFNKADDIVTDSAIPGFSMRLGDLFDEVVVE